MLAWYRSSTTDDPHGCLSNATTWPLTEFSMWLSSPLSYDRTFFTKKWPYWFCANSSSLGLSSAMTCFLCSLFPCLRHDWMTLEAEWRPASSAILPLLLVRIIPTSSSFSASDVLFKRSFSHQARRPLMRGYVSGRRFCLCASFRNRFCAFLERSLPPWFSAPLFHEPLRSWYPLPPDMTIPIASLLAGPAALPF